MSAAQLRVSLVQDSESYQPFAIARAKIVLAAEDAPRLDPGLGSARVGRLLGEERPPVRLRRRMCAALRPVTAVLRGGPTINTIGPLTVRLKAASMR